MGNPDLQRPLLAPSVLQGPRRHLPWERRQRGTERGRGVASSHLDFPGGKLQRIFLDNGRKFHLGFFKSFFGNKRWIPTAVFKLLRFDISLCLQWPLTWKPGDASAGTRSSLLHAWDTVNFRWGHLSWWLESSKPAAVTGIYWSCFHREIRRLRGPDDKRSWLHIFHLFHSFCELSSKGVCGKWGPSADMGGCPWQHSRQFFQGKAESLLESHPHLTEHQPRF